MKTKKQVTQVNFKLEQNDKKGLRTIQDVNYTFNGKAKLNIDKLAQSVTNAVFRKLAAQNASGVDFGIKVSRPFNIIVTIDNRKAFDLSQCIQVTNNAKLKIKNKLYKENSGFEMDRFKSSILAIVLESELNAKDHKNSIEIIREKKAEKKPLTEIK